MLQEVVPSRYRHATIGIFDAGSIIAQMMPLIAWVIIKNTHNWRIAYYIMIAFQTINLVMLFFFYHPPSFAEKQAEHGKTKRQLVRDFDWLGLFLFIAGCTLFIVGVSWGGSMYPWTSATTLAPLIIGFMTLVGLGFYQAYGNLKEPLFPKRLFRATRQ
jgi:MFS family permease